MVSRVSRVIHGIHRRQHASKDNTGTSKQRFGLVLELRLV